jgi:hypothetical protein
MIDCGTCGSTTFVLKADAGAWDLGCSNGHMWVPVPGTELIITVEES